MRLFEFLREGIGEARKPAHLHTQGEVLALGVGRADVLRIGPALNSMLDRADALCGAVANLCTFRRGTVDLHRRRVIDTCAERPFHGLQIFAE